MKVFLDILTHAFFKLSDAALLVMDECHHAQSVKDHAYTRQVFSCESNSRNSRLCCMSAVSQSG